MIRKWINGYFNFTRKDRIAVLVLTILIVLTSLVPYFFSGNTNSQPPLIDSSLTASLKALEVKQLESREGSTRSNTYAQPTHGQAIATLFDFDPNELPADKWKELGVRDRVINTIQNYLAKGGKFRRAADLASIYGLKKDEFERLAPFIKIREVESAVRTSDKFEAHPRSRTYSLVELNSADTTALIALPGIGSKLAQRILNFRDRLGGFYSVDQVGETYGLADSVFQKIKSYLSVNSNNVRKINVNSAGVDDLKTHPYIKQQLAAAIINYRNEHGPFSSPDDLKKIMALSETTLHKILPYIEIR